LRIPKWVFCNRKGAARMSGVNKKRGASIIFLDNACRVLLALRDNTPEIPFPNRWDILGGAIEVGETPEECIIREMREEIDFALANPLLFRIYDMPDRVEYTFWQSATFDIAEIELTEGQKLRWFSENEIQQMDPENFAFGFRNVLLDFFVAKPFVHERKK
jgi:8-oxo-dGTP diphosphatase